MTGSEAVAVLAAYLDVIAWSRVNPQTGDPMQAKTLNLYLQAAAAYLRSTTALQIDITTKGSSEHPRLNKFFADILQSRAKWSEPYPKRLPCTYAMFEALTKQVSCAHKESKTSFFDLFATWQ